MPPELLYLSNLKIELGKLVVQSFTYANPITQSGKYLLFLPLDYTPTKRYPTIFFLHGSGERGHDPELLKCHGLPRIVEQNPAFPFILIAPQCPARRRWPLALLDGLYDAVINRYAIDPQRVYLTGLSLGGYGVWKWALAHPRRFAALAPVCGWGNPQAVSRLAHLPVWAFHGALDEVVPAAETLQLIAALKAAGGTPRVTIYKNATHDAWTQAYANRRLYQWFLKHRNLPINRL